MLCNGTLSVYILLSCSVFLTFMLYIVLLLFISFWYQATSFEGLTLLWYPANKYSMCIVACSRGYFRCLTGGMCLSSYRRCNGRCDCPYCTDELDCYTPPSQPNRAIPTTSWYWWWPTTTSDPLQFNYSKL